MKQPTNKLRYRQCSFISLQFALACFLTLMWKIRQDALNANLLHIIKQGVHEKSVGVILKSFQNFGNERPSQENRIRATSIYDEFRIALR